MQPIATEWSSLTFLSAAAGTAACGTLLEATLDLIVLCMHCVGRLELIMPTRGLHAVGFRERRSGGVELGLCSLSLHHLLAAVPQAECLTSVVRRRDKLGTPRGRLRLLLCICRFGALEAEDARERQKRLLGHLQGELVVHDSVVREGRRSWHHGAIRERDSRREHGQLHARKEWECCFFLDLGKGGPRCDLQPSRRNEGRSAT